MRIPAPVGLACLAALAAASWWLARPDATGPQAPAAVTQPGYYLKNAELEQTDASGRLQRTCHDGVARLPGTLEDRKRLPRSDATTNVISGCSTSCANL
jgi:hypothetical protein